MTTEITTPAEADEPRELTPLQQIGQVLDGDVFSPKIAASLDGTGISAERFKRAALAALSRPEAEYLVSKCVKSTIYTAIMNAAAAGIELHPALGHAYLVPRYNGKLRRTEAHLQIGYKGLIALAQRAGIAVEADVIYAGDRYEVRKGMNPSVDVYPELDPAKRGEWIATYVITHYPSGAKTLTFMSRAEVEDLRDRFSDSWKGGKNDRPGEGAGAKAWRENSEQMAIKTVIRRAAKLWPVSIPGGDGDVVEQAPAPAPMRDVTPGASRLEAFASD